MDSDYFPCVTDADCGKEKLCQIFEFNALRLFNKFKQKYFAKRAKGKCVTQNYATESVYNITDVSVLNKNLPPMTSSTYLPNNGINERQTNKVKENTTRKHSLGMIEVVDLHIKNWSNDTIESLKKAINASNLSHVTPANHSETSETLDNRINKYNKIKSAV